MRSIVNLVKQLKTDEDGAPLIEYTVLIGILLLGVLLVITVVGGWINGQWTALNSAI
jgi:pilus assembly protein Flp/PilA